MIRWLALLFSGLAMTAHAAEPASLGRLFLTPADRAALDAVRQTSQPPEKATTPGKRSTTEESMAETAATPALVTVQGYVKRSDSKGTVWVNGQPVPEKSKVENIEVGALKAHTDSVSIKLPGTGKRVELKAGQRYDPGNGQLTDIMPDLPDRQGSVKPPAPASSR